MYVYLYLFFICNIIISDRLITTYKFMLSLKNSQVLLDNITRRNVKKSQYLT